MLIILLKRTKYVTDVSLSMGKPYGQNTNGKRHLKTAVTRMMKTEWIILDLKCILTKNIC